MKYRIEVDNVVSMVDHWVILLSVTADQPAQETGREFTNLSSRDLRGLAFELMHVAGRCAVNGNSPRLHRTGISRNNSIFSRPFSNTALLTWT
jgi:hypothetical protein